MSAVTNKMRNVGTEVAAARRGRKGLVCACLAALGLFTAANRCPAPIIYTGGGGGTIFDGGGATVPTTSVINVNAGGLFDLTSITVSINVSGGFNGDLYATLRGPGGTGAPFAVLLNRSGVGSANPIGYADAGFNITFATGSPNIHTYGGNGGSQLTGTFAPDGRAIDPNSSPSAFDSAGTGQDLNQFLHTNPNGDWTITFADMVNGGGDSSLVSWSLNITAVPEPVTMALGIFGLGFGGVGLVRWVFRKRASVA
jgi:hypothetical protein